MKKKGPRRRVVRLGVLMQSGESGAGADGAVEGAAAGVRGGRGDDLVMRPDAVPTARIVYATGGGVNRGTGVPSSG